MPLFRKSKEEGLKPLSEREIQERLYGFFHQERSVPAARPGKKALKAVDLRSVEVTPAGVISSDFFRAASETRVQSEQENGESPSPPAEEIAIEEEKKEPPRRYESGSDNGPSTPDDEESFSQVSVKKPVRRPSRKAKKDRKTEALRKFLLTVLERMVFALAVAFSFLSRAFSAFVLWLGESRDGSRRVPAKFILVSLAVIGTGLIFFNVWNSQIKQNAAHAVSSASVGVSGAESGNSADQVVTKLVPVSSDALSRSQSPETQPAAAKKYFSIQVCVAQRQEGALNVVKKLKAGGLPAFYDQGSSRRGGKLYRIMIGKFDAYQTAKRELEVYKKTKVMEPYQDSFIRNLTQGR